MFASPTGVITVSGNFVSPGGTIVLNGGALELQGTSNLVTNVTIQSGTLQMDTTSQPVQVTFSGAGAGILQAEQQIMQETSPMSKPKKWFVFLSSSVAVGCALLIGATILTSTNTGGFSEFPF